MELRIKKRNADKKSETNRIRHLKNIPAVLYSAGKTNENVTVDGAEFHTILRHLKKGRLSNTVFELKTEDNQSVKALIKDIQYHRTTYNVLHLDFQALDDKQPVNVKIPIYCKGIADCVGIKLGGVLRQVIRKLKVRCLPKDIPQEFSLDVTKMQMNDSKRLSDIAIPENVRPIARLEEVAVAIVKR